MSRQHRLLMGSRWSQAAFVALILIVSWLAFTPNPPPRIDLGWDKANHASAFATLLISACWAWPRRRRWAPPALLAYGVFIEIVQSFIPGRDGDWHDVVADAAGLLVGLLLLALLTKLLHLHFTEPS